MEAQEETKQTLELPEDWEDVDEVALSISPDEWAELLERLNKV